MSDPILTCQALTHRYSGRDILRDLNLTLHEGTRVGLIGVNGAGKSTLLRLMAGLERPDQGEITFRRGLRIGYLHQNLGLNDASTVREAIDEGLAEPRALLAEYQALSQSFRPADLERLSRLQSQLDLLDAWNLDLEVERLMSHLQVPAQERRVRELSGGERRRVTLCRTLLSKPDLLILDEPTNHLDAATIEWLEGYLADFQGTLLLVTHDRYFLDRVTDQILELDWGQIQRYEGNYTDYLEQKAARVEELKQQEHVRQRTLARELQWVRKQPKARSAKQKARVARFNELAQAAPPAFHGEVDLVIPSGVRLGKRVLEIKQLTKGFGDRLLLNRFSLDLVPGERWGVIGPNGVGKTTLMRLITGDLLPDSGSIELGPTTRVLYADQGRTQLDPEKSVVEEVADGCQWVQIEDQTISVRNYLRRFLFTDEQANTPIKRLSGGEQNRVQLAKLLRTGANLLILDEPTNDLDLPTLRVLEDALVHFPGCVLVISHDRYFLNRVATGILAFEGEGRVTTSVGSYDRYLETRSAQSSETVTAKPAAPVRALSNKERAELKNMEAAIEAAERDLAAIDAQLADPGLYTDRIAELPEWVSRQTAAKQKIHDLFARWEELERLSAQRAT